CSAKGRSPPRRPISGRTTRRTSSASCRRRRPPRAARHRFPPRRPPASPVARLDSFLRVVAEQDASDLHLHSGNVPVIRHDGDLMDLPFRVLSEAETRRLLFEIIDDGQKEALERERQLDFIYSLPRGGRFRASLFLQRNGLGAVFRVIPNRRPTLDELMLPPAVKRLTQLKNGLVLVTGPTGS